MISFNQCVFVGNVGKAPELQSAADGTPYVHFRLAVDRYAGKDEDGSVREETMWLTVVAWRKLAEQVATYVKKGALVLVSGQLVIRTYTNKQREEKTSVEVLAQNVRFLEPKSQVPQSDADEASPVAE